MKLLLAAIPFLLVALLANPVLAGGGVEIVTRPAATGSDCPALTKAKYPFLSCRANASGGVTLAGKGLRTEGVPTAIVQFRGPQYLGDTWDTRHDD